MRLRSGLQAGEAQSGAAGAGHPANVPRRTRRTQGTTELAGRRGSLSAWTAHHSPSRPCAGLSGRPAWSAGETWLTPAPGGGATARPRPIQGDAHPARAADNRDRPDPAV
ncbi:hypothetical protein GCM10025734_83440 [Kitasatospora paranensis]